MFPALCISLFRSAFLALAFVMIAALAVPGVAAASRLDLQQDLPEQVSRQLDLQSELPKDSPPVEQHWRWHMPPELARLLFWLMVAVGVILLIYALKEVIPAFGTGESGWSDEPAASEAGDAATGGAAAAAVAADDLARQGRFAEAMHVLLLQSLGDMRRRLEEHFADSLTSREILRASRLSETGRASLRDIIARVERTYFGEYPAGAEDYHGCRDSFTQLTQALGGPAIA
jgi:hypothetical protein